MSQEDNSSKVMAVIVGLAFGGAIVMMFLFITILMKVANAL